MKKTIKDFIENQNLSNGFLPIGTPTGSGKSTAASTVIAEEYKKEKSLPSVLRHHFFYLTNLKANVKDEADMLKKAFEDEGLEDEYEDKVLVLPSNLDGVMKLVEDPNEEFENLGKKYDFMTSDPSFKDLSQKLKSYKKIKELVEKGVLTKDFLQSSFEEAGKAEEKFREFLTNHFLKEFKDIPDMNDRYEKIRDEYPSLLEIYPSIKVFNRPIILTTIDKFYLGVNPIIKPSFKLINDNMIKNSIVFIDEIDSCKSAILKQQIDSSKKFDLDLPSMFQRIDGALNHQEFPNKMISYPDNKEAYDKIKEKSDWVYGKCKLKHLLKLSSELEEDFPFLFKDNDVITIGDNSEESRYYIDYEESEKYNYIKKGKDLPKNALLLPRFVNMLNGCWRSVFHCFNIMAYNYEEYERGKGKAGENNAQDHKATLCSMLHPFGLDEREIEYVVQRINAHPYVHPKEGDEWLDSFYDFYMDGFSFNSFKDEEKEIFRTKIRTLSLFETPEYFLSRLVNQAKIIGLSATSTIDSPICNFPLSYFKDLLGPAYVSLTEEEKERMKYQFQNVIQKNNKASIDVVECGSSVSKEDQKGNQEKLNKTLAEFLFEGDEKMQKVFINRFLSFSDDGYKKVKLSRFFLALKDFFVRDKLKTFLVFRNEAPKDFSSEEINLYSSKSVKEFLRLINKYLNANKTFDVISFTSSTADEFKKHRNGYFKENDKLVVLTTYPSASIGQNLQFTEEEEAENKLNPDFNKKEKDFDSIYLEKPTNILVNIFGKNSSKLSKEDLILAIYQLRALYENGEIDKKQFEHYLNCAAKKADHIGKKVNVSKQYSFNLYELPSVNMACWKNIIQAVGRICRTREKSKDKEIVIYYDKDIAGIDCSFLDGKLLNRETQALVDKIRSFQKTELTKPLDPYSWELTKNCSITNERLQSILSINRDGWTINNMKGWIGLRDFVLKYPTLSQEQYWKISPLLRCLYVKNPFGEDFSKYWFKKDVNGHFINGNSDFFENVHLFPNYEPKALTVSEDDCGLSKVVSIDFLAKAFKEKGYPITFPKNTFVLNPVAYTNIYKGALGEFAGKKILEEFAIKLKNIENESKFEIFDFFEAESEIYVDFKNWHGSTTFDEEKMISKIQDKIIRVKGKGAIIINLINPDKKIVYGKDDLLMVPGLLKPTDDTEKEYVVDYDAIEKIKSFIYERKENKI